MVLAGRTFEAQFFYIMLFYVCDNCVYTLNHLFHGGVEQKRKFDYPPYTSSYNFGELCTKISGGIYAPTTGKKTYLFLS